MSTAVPILTIDGPSGSGKGTVSRAVARHLGWHFLDSGAIYRALAIAVTHAGVSLDDVEAIARVAEKLDLVFVTDDSPKVLLSGQDVTEALGLETTGNQASRVAAYGEVRSRLLEKQREFRRDPGLVADGRDMGTVVFQEAPHKVFLTASAETRANRRYRQLLEKGVDVNLQGLTKEIEDRDRRDRERAESPLVPARDALMIDSSNLTIQEVIDQVLQWIRR